MSDQSTKELEDRERFAPSYEEIQRVKKRLMVEWFLESEETSAVIARLHSLARTRPDLNDWIANETDRRIAEHCEEHMPIICGRVKP